MSASLATSRAGALERFHECLLSGASAKNAARSSHAFKKNEVKQQAICAHAEEADTVSASVGKQKARKSLVKSCQAPRRVEPSEDAFSTEAWCPNGHGFCCLCGCFFSNMARKAVDFQGLLLGAFFVPVFGPGLLTCAARVPIFGPKIWTPSRGQKQNSDCNYMCPLLWRPVALELWSGSMNVC